MEKIEAAEEELQLLNHDVLIPCFGGRTTMDLNGDDAFNWNFIVRFVPIDRIVSVEPKLIVAPLTMDKGDIG